MRDATGEPPDASIFCAWRSCSSSRRRSVTSGDDDEADIAVPSNSRSRFDLHEDDAAVPLRWRQLPARAADGHRRRRRILQRWRSSGGRMSAIVIASISARAVAVVRVAASLTATNRSVSPIDVHIGSGLASNSIRSAGVAARPRRSMPPRLDLPFDRCGLRRGA